MSGVSAASAPLSSIPFHMPAMAIAYKQELMTYTPDVAPALNGRHLARCDYRERAARVSTWTPSGAAIRLTPLPVTDGLAKGEKR